MWWAALLLMLFLPSATWKHSEAGSLRMRVTVHEPAAPEHELVFDNIQPGPRELRKAARRTRKTRMPGLSQTD